MSNYNTTILSLEPGDSLSGRYRLERVIGEGGMAVVWLARDLNLDRPVAIKVLPTALSRDTRAITRLKAEAGRNLDLTHPNIVRLHSFEQDPVRGNRAYLVMQYVAGRTLHEILAENSDGLPKKQLQKWGSQVASAIDFAHKRGILHRDIKPSNIIIEEETGTAYLMDFGIAGETRDTMTMVTGRQESSGTLLYMSPQQLVGKNSKSNDIYSFAATMYEGLCGHPPFQSGDIAYQIREIEPEPIESLSEAANTALLAGLAKDVNERPETCMALLNAWVQETPPVKTMPPRQSSSPLHRKPIGLVVGIVVTVLLFIAAMWYMPHVTQPSYGGSAEKSRRINKDRYKSAADLVDIETATSLLRERQLSWPDIRPVKQSWAKGENAFQMAKTNQDIAAWQAAGISFEHANIEFEKAISFDQQAVSANRSKLTFHEKYDRIAWVNHEKISTSVAAIKQSNAQAEAYWSAGEFTKAHAAWEQASQNVTDAEILNVAVQAASSSRSIFHKKYDLIAWFDHPVISAAVAEIDSLDVLATEDWNVGEFADAQAMWEEAPRTVDSASLLNNAAFEADTAKQAYKRQLGSVSPPWYNEVVDDVEHVTFRADSTQEAFLEGHFSEAVAGWKTAAKEIEQLKKRHDKAVENSLAARNEWKSSINKVPDPLYYTVREDMSELRVNAEEDQRLFDSGHFDEATLSWHKHMVALKDLISQHGKARNSAELARVAWSKAGSRVPRWIDNTDVTAKRDEASLFEHRADSAVRDAQYDEAISLYTQAASSIGDAIQFYKSAVPSLLDDAAQARSEGRYEDSLAKLDEASPFLTTDELKHAQTMIYEAWSEKEVEKLGNGYEETWDQRQRNASMALSVLKMLFDLDSANQRGVVLKNQVDAYSAPKHLDHRTVNLGSGINMAFVWMEPTDPVGFKMGSPLGEDGRGKDEDQHTVVLTNGFWLGQTEVTQGQYRAVMGENPSSLQGNDNYPVDRVKFENAHSFCQKLSERAKLHVRLPSESEWEYACRAGSTTPFNTGSTISPDQANYKGLRAYGNGHKGVYRKKAIPVGSLHANAWGLYDMHGNVSEWCEDWYGEYPNGISTNPTGARPNKYGIIRGGSSTDDPKHCRSARRRTKIRSSSSDHRIGFRVCLD